MSYAFGGDILIRRALVDGYNDLDSRNFTVEVFHDAWKQPGDIATLPVIIKRSPIVNNSSKYIYDNSHVKLKSVSLRYRVPVEKMKVPFESLEVGINGSNLHYWFMEASPEGRNGVAELRNPYPEMRTFTLNINTTF